MNDYSKKLLAPTKYSSFYAIKKLPSNISKVLKLKRIAEGLKQCGNGIHTLSNIRKGCNQIWQGILHMFGATAAQQQAALIDRAVAHLSGEKQLIYKQLIANFLNYQLLYNTLPQTSRASAMAHVVNIDTIMAMLDNMPVMDLVGVQPMSGPVALGYHLQVDIPEDTPDNSTGRNVSMQVFSTAVTAGCRKLTASFDIEVAQDASFVHSADVALEFRTMLGKIVAKEFQSNIIANLVKLASPYEPKYETLDMPNYFPILINFCMNEIGRKTRRSAGNWVVLSPSAEAMLRSTEGVGMMWDNTQPETDLKLLGTLYNSVKVYRSQNLLGADVLVGYKGHASEIDCGLIYHPYILVMDTGIVVNPETFQPRIQLMTREGQTINKNGADYYMKFNLPKESL